jgi:hypothetical protein
MSSSWLLRPRLESDTVRDGDGVNRYMYQRLAVKLCIMMVLGTAAVILRAAATSTRRARETPNLIVAKHAVTCLTTDAV